MSRHLFLWQDYCLVTEADFIGLTMDMVSWGQAVVYLKVSHNRIGRRVAPEQWYEALK